MEIKKTGIYQNLKKIKLLRKFVQGIRYIRDPHKYSFHGDIMFEKAVKQIGDIINVTAFVETGTFRGYTTMLFARLFPNIPVYTCEIVYDSYIKSKKNLLKYPNVKVYHMSSPDFLNLLVKENLLGDNPMFYLDAHWLDQWPIEEEIKIISEKIKKTVIFIDDFKIEDNPNFRFDVYKEKECSLERINPNISSKNKYNLFFPNYVESDAFLNVKSHEKFVVGYPIIFQNHQELFKKLLTNEFFSKNFVDRSELIGKR